MKTIILILVLIILSTQSFAQILTLHKNDGSINTVNLSEIDSITFSGFPCPGVPTITYEDKIYNTVLIGGQCWLKENLDVGTMITGGDPQTSNTTIEKYCYNNEPDSCDVYGGLYQWGEAVQYEDPPEGAQGICPSGWHIPTIGEFQTLAAAVDDDGNALKEIRQGTGDGTGTNTSGFSALLAGYYSDNDMFAFVTEVTAYWGSSINSPTNSSALAIYSTSSGIDIDYVNIIDAGNIAISIRCIKD